jgi:OOP family OmpA-OmpF porin
VLAIASMSVITACSSPDIRQDYLASTVSPNINAARALPPPGRDWKAVLDQPPNGNSFDAYLSRNYKSLMLFEVDNMNDYISADMYAKRSLAAARGEPVALLPLEEFNLPEAALPSLRQAQADANELFSKGAREKFPKEAARVQSSFDCWVEQQEENHQPTHIAECRDTFVESLRDLRVAMTPPPPPAPRQPAPTAAPKPTFQDSYTVYFAFDSADLNDASRATINEVIRAVQAQNAGASIIGFTDTSGPAEYNKQLSERRARAVTQMLLDAGVRPAVVTTEGRGEADLAKPTGDNVQEPANRRAVVNIR